MNPFKDISNELKSLKVTKRKIAWFALIIAAVLTLVAWRLGRASYGWAWISGVAAMLVAFLALFFWQSLEWPYRAWMALAFSLGWLVSTVFLTLSFYLLVVPIGLWFRLTGKDPLGLKPAPAGTYWVKAPDLDKARYLKKF